MRHVNLITKSRIVAYALLLMLGGTFFSACPGDPGDSDSGATIAAPVAAFTATPGWGLAALPVQFTDLSRARGAAIRGYNWDFGDGATSVDQHPTHVYSTPGTYTVTLTLTTALGTSSQTMTDCVQVSPNQVVNWNNAAMRAMAANNWMPPQIARGLAMMHAAIYDAVNAVERTHEIYYAGVPAIPGTCKEAAAANAAHRILTSLLPAQSADFDAELAAALAEIPDGDGKISGAFLGQDVADLILRWRAHDGSAMTMGPPYLGGNDPGDWRPTPPGFMPGMFVSWQMVSPFAMTSGRQFRPGPPPALDSALYATDLNEVKTIGAKISATRSMDQAMMATFWVGMPGTIMETGRMNLVVQQAVAAHELTLGESARLFALVNIAMADAAIAGIDCKYHYSAWRPVTAIREAASDGNPATDADPAWESYITAPAHPEYISTHGALTQAAAEVIANFFGADDADVTLPAFMNPAVTRHYDSFVAIAEEAGLSRIYGGIHFRFSYDAGSLLGEEIGDYVSDNLMRPL